MTAMPPAAALAPSDLLARLKEIVGGGHVLTGDASTRRYRSGFRYGGGDVLAVVHAADTNAAERARQTLLAKVHISDQAAAPKPVVVKRISS